MVWALENTPFPLEFSAYMVMNITEFYECSFLVGLYYLAQTILTCQHNATKWMAYLAHIMGSTTFPLTI